MADGSRIASVDAEIISYAVLDVLAKPVFGMWLLFTHDSMSQRYVTLYTVSHDCLANYSQFCVSRRLLVRGS